MTIKNYFTKAETSCQCGCGFDITDEFRTKLNELRELVKQPLVLTSGARCVKHNTNVKGSARSQHVNGIAADISAADSETKYKIMKAAFILGFGGIGVHDKFIHVDTRKGNGVVWLY